MLPARLSKSLIAAAMTASVAAAACSGPAPAVIHEYDAYEGEAYPSKRTPLDVPPGGVVFITNSYADTLSVLDATTGETLGTYPVGRDPVSLDGPHHVAVAKDGSAVYVALSYPVQSFSGPHASHGSSTRNGYAQKLDGHDLHVVGQTRVDNNPGDIVLSEDGERLVTSHFDLQRAIKNPTDIEAARATLAVIDPAKMFLTGSEPAVKITTCVAPHGMVLSRPDGAKAYVACYGEDSIAVVDLDQGKVLERVPMADGVSGFGDPHYGPYSVVLSPAGGKIAVGNTVSKDVRVLDTATGKIVPELTMPMFGAPYFVAWSADEKRLAVPLQTPDALVVMDMETKMEVNRRDFTGDECPLPHVAMLAVDGTYALVCEGDHKAPGKVLWLDPDTLETKRATDVGVYPDAIVSYRKEAP